MHGCSRGEWGIQPHAAKLGPGGSENDPDRGFDSLRRYQLLRLVELLTRIGVIQEGESNLIGGPDELSDAEPDQFPSLVWQCLLVEVAEGRERLAWRAGAHGLLLCGLDLQLGFQGFRVELVFLLLQLFQPIPHRLEGTPAGSAPCVALHAQ